MASLCSQCSHGRRQRSTLPVSVCHARVGAGAFASSGLPDSSASNSSQPPLEKYGNTGRFFALTRTHLRFCRSRTGPGARRVCSRGAQRRKESTICSDSEETNGCVSTLSSASPLKFGLAVSRSCHLSDAKLCDSDLLCAAVAGLHNARMSLHGGLTDMP